MSIVPLSTFEDYMDGFIMLNRITAQFRDICILIGTNLDSYEARNTLINLQRRVLYELQITRTKLTEVWFGANNAESQHMTSDETDRLFACFTALADYHMRALLKTLHLITLFPTANTELNCFGSNKQANAWIMATGKTLQMCVGSLITIGLKDVPVVELEQNDEIQEEDFLSSELEIDILRNEYKTLQTIMEEVASMLCVTPWKVLPVPTELIHKASLQESTTYTQRSSMDQTRKSSMLSNLTDKKSERCPSPMIASIGTVEVHNIPSIGKQILSVPTLCAKIRSFFARRKAFTLLLISVAVVLGVALTLILSVGVFPMLKLA